MDNDINLPAKDLNNSEKYAISKIFHTIQEEGPYAGWPAICIVLTGYNHEDKTSAVECSTREILDAISSGTNYYKLVIITGGEPFLQNLYLLIKVLLDYSYIVQIETNGDIFPSNNFLETFLPTTPIMADTLTKSCLRIIINPKAEKQWSNINIGWIIWIKNNPGCYGLSFKVPYSTTGIYSTKHPQLNLFPFYKRYISPIIYCHDISENAINVTQTKNNYIEAVKKAQEWSCVLSLQHPFI